MTENHGIQPFFPLAGVAGIVMLLTLAKQLLYCVNYCALMTDLMGSFFIVLSVLKMLNIEHFVAAYRSYDIIAREWKYYAYAYPFVEFLLGCLYWLRWFPFATNVITLLLMVETGLSILRVLLQGQWLECACLGAVFRIPLTYVSLLESIVMGGMAAWMLWGSCALMGR